MPRLPETSSSGTTALHAVGLVLGLVVPLVIAWGRDGPPADHAFWLVMTYFVELAAWIAFEIGVEVIRGRGSEA